MTQLGSRIPEDAPRAPIRAAAVRSHVHRTPEVLDGEPERDHQRYAEQRGFAIVRTYADSGKSGLRLDGRDALKQLIDDVRSGAADFRAILVYDVSRWGRFQDADESAYYEFICKEAGIAVHYCAEQFENDGSLSATIIKSMKRAMAGEYSRELSVKVFAGQCRLIGLGFRQGGMAGYGLRRQLIDEQRQPKGELARGTQKSLQTDRVVLVPGPAHEIENVRRMYRMFVDEGRSEGEIATILNDEGTLTDLGRPWTRGTVHQVLTNEKYVGNNVYNRISFKLKKKRVANPPDMWIRASGAFAAIVEPTLFEAVRRIIQERSRRFTTEEMLERLAGLLRRTGWLSGLVIDEHDDMPSSSAYRTRFGSLLRAYRLVGYSPGRDYEYVEINRVLRSMHARCCDRGDQGDRATRRHSPHGSHYGPHDRERRIHDLDCDQPIVSDVEWRSSMEASSRHRPPARHHCRDPNGRGQPRSVRLLPAAQHRHLDGEAATEGRERLLPRRVSL